MKTKSVLVIPDLQIPYHDPKSLEAVHKLMKDYKWDEVVCIGDFLDFDSISSHNKDNLREISGKTVFKDYGVGNRILDKWQKLCPRAKFTLIEGNHEYRVERYIDANPQMEGMIEVPIGLKLKERGFNWVPFWSQGKTYDIGKATFIHGRATTQFHTKHMAYRYGRNVFYGHTHDIQQYSVEQDGKDNVFVGQSLGCLCLPQRYMRGQPTKWQQAISVFHFFEDGLFNYEVVRIFKNRFFYNGKVYGGN